MLKKFEPSVSILVVDDDAMVRSVLVEYLEDMGFTNLNAPDSSEEALELIESQEASIDLIISDWEMPVVTGLSLLRAAREHEHRQHTPFIMVTSQRSMERFKITQAAQWKVSAYVVKPFRQEVLRGKIWEAMGWEPFVKSA